MKAPGFPTPDGGGAGGFLHALYIGVGAGAEKQGKDAGWGSGARTPIEPPLILKDDACTPPSLP